MLLEVNDLAIGFADNKSTQVVVDHISFQVNKGEILGIVGESGSGKSMTALSIMGLQKDTAIIQHGQILLDGEDLLAMTTKKRQSYLGKEIAMIFQEPMTSLNPVMKIGQQVSEMLAIHTDLNSKARKAKTIQALEEVGLANAQELYHKYPHELSGGMRQRVMIAMAVICKPRLLIADEPTTALDVSVQAQILTLLKKINKKYGISIVLISHDLGVIRNMCERTIVMAEGKIVEEGLVTEIFHNPKQEYTKKLLAAVPSIHNSRMRDGAILDRKGTKMLNVENLNVYYYQNGKVRRGDKKQIVKQASFSVNKGEVVGIVGESGSGKSTLAKAIVGLNPDYEGTINCEEKFPQMVFQDPYSSLNQAKKVGWILEEPLKIQGKFSKAKRKELVREKLKEVGLSPDVATRYVHQLSGGQRQRVCIATALMLETGFIVLDEAVSALDVTIQRQILTLLVQLKEKHNLTYLFISHDMNVIHEMCDRVLVMYQGEIIEQGLTTQIFNHPEQEYTRQLIDAVL